MESLPFWKWHMVRKNDYKSWPGRLLPAKHHSILYNSYYRDLVPNFCETCQFCSLALVWWDPINVKGHNELWGDCLMATTRYLTFLSDGNVAESTPWLCLENSKAGRTNAARPVLSLDMIAADCRTRLRKSVHNQKSTSSIIIYYAIAQRPRLAGETECERCSGECWKGWHSRRSERSIWLRSSSNWIVDQRNHILNGRRRIASWGVMTSTLRWEIEATRGDLFHP